MNKSIFISVLCYFSCNAAFSQKLPNIQESSVRVPLDVKIDGKATEWNNKFQAYNKATDLFYTISNDQDKLYLIIQITDPVIINKVISAGITFVINKPNDKNNREDASITYPIFDNKDKPQIDVKNTPKIDPSVQQSLLKADSFMTANNKRLSDKSKWVRVTGMGGLDTLTSVFNRVGIKVAQLFNNRMIYTMEMAIDLKNIGLSINDMNKFTYEIRSNGASMESMNGITIEPGAPGSRIRKVLTIKPGAMPPSALPAMMATTDFKGEYQLAK